MPAVGHLVTTGNAATCSFLHWDSLCGAGRLLSLNTSRGPFSPRFPRSFVILPTALKSIPIKRQPLLAVRAH